MFLNYYSIARGLMHYSMEWRQMIFCKLKFEVLEFVLNCFRLFYKVIAMTFYIEEKRIE
jgi:hypothetical protein